MAHYTGIRLTFRPAKTSKYLFDIYNAVSNEHIYLFDIAEYVIEANVDVTLHSIVPLMYGGGEITIEIPIILATMSSTHAPGIIDIRLKRVRVDMVGGWIPTGTLEVDLSRIEVMMTSPGGTTGILGVTLPLIDVYMAGMRNVYKTIVISTKGGEVTTYSGLTFNSYFKIEEKYYGVNSNGIYLLEGTPPEASFITGYTNFDTDKVKSPCDLYILLESNCEVNTRIGINNLLGASYPVEHTSGRLRLRKANIGRGRKCEFASLNIAANGTFEIDTIKLLAEEGRGRHIIDTTWLKAEIPMVEVDI